MPRNSCRTMRQALIPAILVAMCVPPVWAESPRTDIASPSLHRGLAELLDFAPSGLSLGTSYYMPTQSQRDIDVMTLDLSRSWRVWRVVELQERFTVFNAHGTRTDAPYGVNPDSTATGAAVGPAVRLYFLDFAGLERARPFLEASAQFLFTPAAADGFPSGGSGVNGFERAGAGVLFRIRANLAIEATYQWYSHVSNGAGVSPQNPMWNGRGGSVALRRDL